LHARLNDKALTAESRSACGGASLDWGSGFFRFVFPALYQRRLRPQVVPDDAHYEPFAQLVSDRPLKMELRSRLIVGCLVLEIERKTFIDNARHLIDGASFGPEAFSV
jgi:hypothetical protein